MGELIPFPHFRLPCLRVRLTDEDEEEGESCFQEMIGFSEFHMNRRAMVNSPCLGIFKRIVQLIGLIVLLFYSIYTEKAYLEKASVTGWARMSLQHPVRHCNPMHAFCKENFSSKPDIPYCARGDIHQGANVGHPLTIGCKYVDEFDLLTLGTESTLDKLLVPTRISTFEQKLHEDCQHSTVPCPLPFDIENEKVNYVADIEDFTLLIDHGFTCAMLDMQMFAWKSQGFYSECPEEDCKKLQIRCLNNDDCPVSAAVQESQSDDAGAVEIGTVKSIPVGDIFKVSELLKIAGVDLERRNEENATTRVEGEAIIIEVHYKNYEENSWPNSLPPTYEYVISRLPSETAKMTSADYIDDSTRIVRDVHGVYIIVRVSGHLGIFSYSKLLLMFLEIVTMLGAVHWIVKCLAMNRTGARGEQFARYVEQPIDIDDLTKYKPFEMQDYRTSSGTESS